MTESTQHKLDRVRPPRVQITYDVEIGNAIEKKELPLVVGILSDLSGQPKEKLPKLSDRRFINIDRDNFIDVLESINPRLAIQVDNTIAGDGSKLNIELNFYEPQDINDKNAVPKSKDFDHFDPISIVNKVAPLKKLFEARQRLRDLLGKLDGNDDLDKLLQDVVANTEGLKEIKSALPVETPVPAPAA
ncbi:type VI secretion system contractile sheath small subunit [Iodobacter sp.]|uniref:type VI secretion system contractile sheath small subunit n=1 Tax=Iodobacter sp. TaxID=1915058 RepID=UPI0025F04EC7|nr:type VI secretion system contractile sheath small subunit [Iodobacter sp.]